MAREEIKNDIINTLFECTHSGEDDTISDKEFAEVLADKFINYETDLLKEFVEWLKERLKEQYTRLYNGDESGIVRSIGVHIVMSNLDTHLEKFLEKTK